MSIYSTKVVYELALEDITYFLNEAADSDLHTVRTEMQNKAAQVMMSLHQYEAKDDAGVGAQNIVNSILDRKNAKNRDDEAYNRKLRLLNQQYGR